MNFPDDRMYAETHEWIKIEGTTAKIGITDYAQEQLGDVTFVDLPAENTEVSQAEPMCTIESVKTVSDTYAAMSGKIAQVNSALETAPEYINQSPYKEGWIAELEISDESEKDKLMDAKAYEAFIQGS